MSSYFLGKIVSVKNRYEVHAFTKAASYRNLPSAEISDSSLYQQLLKSRYHLLESGRPIYCTGITPISEKRIESNPHDEREGAVHVVALNKNNNIECAISVATDLGQSDHGTLIGLPLENRWYGSPDIGGIDLTLFRQSYVRNNYSEERDIQPWEMAELYRHFRTQRNGELAARFAVYIGLYHLCVHMPRKVNLTPTWLFVFDAIPKYFNLYKLASGAVIRNLTINTPSQFIAPRPNEFIVKDNSILYKGNVVSRNLAIPIPVKHNGRLIFESETVSFLDGVADVRRLENDILAHPIIPPYRRADGFNVSDIIKMRFSLAATMFKFYQEQNKKYKWICSVINKYALRRLGIKKIEFI